MPEPAFNLAKFNRQLEFQIEKKVNERTLEKVRLSVQFTFEEIIDNWPVDTYWSLANHRISITGRDVVKLEPRTRPDTSGALVGKAQTENQKELDKLDRLTTDRRQYNVVIDHVQSITVSVEVDTPEATAMTDLDRVRLYGLRQWSMEVTFFQDFASGNVDDTVWDIINNARFVELRMKPDSTTTFGPNNPQYSGRAVLPQHSPVSGAVGEVSTIPITFQSSGELTRTTS